MALAFDNTGRLTTVKAHKYKAVPKVIDGIRFASTAEADAYTKLRILQKAGKIVKIELQPHFKLHAGIVYVADFRITWVTGSVEIVDVKGHETPVFKLKMKLMKVDHPDVKVILWA
jgi:hypothetical protein